MSEPVNINPGDVVTTEQVLHVYNGLRDRSLPAAEWTHGAHLCAGLAMVHDMGLAEAEAIMPDTIRNYNEACGGENTDTEGYHHTITLFYLRDISHFLSAEPECDLGELATRLLASKRAARDYPLHFYSRERLFSVDARRGWVDADL